MGDFGGAGGANGFLLGYEQNFRWTMINAVAAAA